MVMAYADGGRALNDIEVRQARDLFKGKTAQEIVNLGMSANLSPQQFGQIFGETGETVQAYGYGTRDGVTGGRSGYTFDGGKWTPSKQEPYSYGPSDTRETGNPLQYDQQNPYLQQMASQIGQQYQQNLERNILPTVRSGAQAVGGFGGSRQGVVEANALRDANTAMANAVSDLYYKDYGDTLNRQLQKYGTDTQYNLGLGQLAAQNLKTGIDYELGMGNLALNNLRAGNEMTLGMGNLDVNRQKVGNDYTLGQGQLSLGNRQADNQLTLGREGFANARDVAGINASAQMSSAGSAAAASMANSANNYNLGMAQLDLAKDKFALDAFGNLVNLQSGMGTNTYNMGSEVQNAPWKTTGNYISSLQPFTGFNQTVTQGGNMATTIGSTLAGAQLGNLLSGL